MSQMDKIMNCKDYKEALTADPGFEDESGHVDSCASCQAYGAEILAFNARIAAAMAINVPELTMPELPAIDAEKVTSLVGRRITPKPVWFALAATVLLAVFVGIRAPDMGSIDGTLEEQVLAHLDLEPRALKVTGTPVSNSRLAKVVPGDIAAMNHDAGLITYAQTCVINGKTIPHLVIQGEYGPVTILLMPEEKISAAKSLDGVNIQGVILPVGDGSIAIIGNRKEQLERIKKNVLDSVNWST
jgi:uncharacterized protein DUF3379